MSPDGLRWVWFHILVVAMLLVVGPSVALADLLEFPTGDRVELPAEIRGDLVTLRLPGRTYEFRRDEFRTIVTYPDPESGWATRWEAASTEPRAAFAAAWWAIEHGLIDEGARAIRAVHSLDPTLQPAKGLCELLDQLSTQLQDPEAGRLRPWRAGGYQVERGHHLVLLHRHAKAEAERRVEELERVVRAAYLLFGSMGLEPELPSERLIVVWFDDEREFEDFVRREAGSPQPGLSGYYSPARHLAATLDPRASRWYRTEVAGISRAETKEADGNLKRREFLRNLRCETADLSTTAHELAHLIMADSGVARPGERPLWLLEGLATQFEVVRGGRWAGFGPVNVRRLDDWRATRRRPSLEQLDQDEGFGHGYSGGAYAAAWSWTFFLRKRHPELLIAWMEADLPFLRDELPMASNRLGEADLESEWREFVDALQTRLDRVTASESR